MTYTPAYQQTVSLAAGANTITVPAPAATQSLGIMVTGATTATETFATLAVANAGIGFLPKQYVQALVPTSGGARFPTVFVDALPGQNATVTIYNESANAINATVTAAAFKASAAEMQNETPLVERFGWIGWEGSNINVFSASVSRINLQIPIAADMILLGIEADIAMAIGNDTTTHFEEVLTAIGYNRAYQSEVAYPIGSDAANPAGTSSGFLTAPGFGTGSADSNCNYGPNSGSLYPGVLGVTILKQSNEYVSEGQGDHLSLDTGRLPLAVGDSLWFHMAGQSEGTATSSQIDAEMQIVVRYALT